MAIVTTFTGKISSTLTVTRKGVVGDDQELVFSNSAKYKSSEAIKSTTSPTCAATFADDRQLTAGTETVDLTALIGDNWGNNDFTGFRLLMMAFDANSDNTAEIVITPGAANPYNFLSGSNDQITLSPGGQFSAYIPTGLDNVSASACELDVTSTDSDAKYKLVMAAGN